MAPTVVFSLGTCAVFLFIVVQEGYRWGDRKFKEVTQAETGTLLVGSDLPPSHKKSWLKYASIEVTLRIFLPSPIVVSGCEGLVPRDTKSLLIPSMQRSEIVGVVAGFGTTFAAMPDLIAMLRRRSSAGMNPRMAAIMGVLQVLWVYNGLLILSRPVVL